MPPADEPATPTPSQAPDVPLRVRAGRVVFATGAVVFAGVLGWTTWQSFERDSDPPALAALEAVDATAGIVHDAQAPAGTLPAVSWPTLPAVGSTTSTSSTALPTQAMLNASVLLATSPAHPSQTRAADLIVDGQPWTGPTFDGRPIRPVRTVTMRTTAYSPDARSCGKWADGITASGMSVWTNGMKLAAADPSLPFGTILTVPGYNDGQPIPVLDRGGAIKGNRLDLLYPTHDIALQWGVQDLEVVVWEFADE